MPTGRKSISGDDVRTRPNIVLVDLPNHVRMGLVSDSAPGSTMHFPAETSDLRTGCTIKHDHLSRGQFILQGYCHLLFSPIQNDQ